jgi:hypothetical protein
VQKELLFPGMQTPGECCSCSISYASANFITSCREPFVPSPSRIDNHGANGGQSTRLSYTDTPVSQSPGFSMDTLDLGPPIATLRSLGALTKVGPTSGSQVRDSSLRTSSNGANRYSSCDPVSRGVLSIHEAQRAINMYTSVFPYMRSFK